MESYEYWALGEFQYLKTEEAPGIFLFQEKKFLKPLFLIYAKTFFNVSSLDLTVFYEDSARQMNLWKSAWSYVMFLCNQYKHIIWSVYSSS